VAHAGIRASVRLISARFVWPEMAKQVAGWARECVACQRAKVVRHVHLAPERIPMPARRFAHVHVDIVGPLPVSQGFSHVLTMIDRSTRWPEVVPLSSTATPACVHALLQAWVSCFGVPAVLTSDRGPQFTSALWAGMCEALGITHRQTTAYHPEANGMVERLHRRLKDALRAREASARWAEHLPWILLGLRAASTDQAKRSPAEAVYGSSLMLPGQYLASEDPSPGFYRRLARSVAAFEPAPVLHNTPEDNLQPDELPEALMAAPMVFVRRDGPKRPLAALYDGPYVVLQRARNVFKLQVGTRQELVSTSRLKPAFLGEDELPAQPPVRGRPKRVSFLQASRMPRLPGEYL
jgi:Integrase core domain/Integrase zinc binding domain